MTARKSAPATALRASARLWTPDSPWPVTQRWREVRRGTVRCRGQDTGDEGQVNEDALWSRQDELNVYTYLCTEDEESTPEAGASEERALEQRASEDSALEESDSFDDGGGAGGGEQRQMRTQQRAAGKPPAPPPKPDRGRRKRGGRGQDNRGLPARKKAKSPRPPRPKLQPQPNPRRQRQRMLRGLRRLRDNQIRVISWNMRGGLEVSGSANSATRDALTETLRAHRPDVVMLQETWLRHEEGPDQLWLDEIRYAWVGLNRPCGVAERGEGGCGMLIAAELVGKKQHNGQHRNVTRRAEVKAGGHRGTLWVRLQLSETKHVHYHTWRTREPANGEVSTRPKCGMALGQQCGIVQAMRSQYGAPMQMHTRQTWWRQPRQTKRHHRNEQVHWGQMENCAPRRGTGGQ